MKTKIKTYDHSVKITHSTYLKILKLAKEEQRSIRVIIDLAIKNSIREKQKQLLEKTKGVFG